MAQVRFLARDSWNRSISQTAQRLITVRPSIDSQPDQSLSWCIDKLCDVEIRSVLSFASAIAEEYSSAERTDLQRYTLSGNST